MYRTTTYTFQVCKASVDYTCKCDVCGKTLRRKATVEHTVNPWNKNPDGSVKSQMEVYRSAWAEAAKKAAELQDVDDTCKTCVEKPYYDHLRGLLTTDGADKVYADLPRDHPDYKIRVGLEEWKYIEDAWVRDATAEFGYTRLGKRLTKKAKQWAEKKGIPLPGAVLA